GAGRALAAAHPAPRLRLVASPLGADGGRGRAARSTPRGAGRARGSGGGPQPGGAAAADRRVVLAPLPRRPAAEPHRRDGTLGRARCPEGTRRSSPLESAHAVTLWSCASPPARCPGRALRTRRRSPNARYAVPRDSE